MILRSGRRIGGDAVIIDFDYSSREWRKNKIAIGQGSFKSILIVCKFDLEY